MQDKINWLKVEQQYNELNQLAAEYNKLNPNKRSDYYDAFDPDICEIQIGSEIEAPEGSFNCFIDLIPEWIERYDDIEYFSDSELIETQAQPYYNSKKNISYNNLWIQNVKIDIFASDTFYNTKYYFGNLMDLASSINNALNGKQFLM